MISKVGIIANPNPKDIRRLVGYGSYVITWKTILKGY